MSEALKDLVSYKYDAEHEVPASGVDEVSSSWWSDLKKEFWAWI